jgi:hypothetical protein
MMWMQLFITVVVVVVVAAAVVVVNVSFLFVSIVKEMSVS